MAPAPDPTEVDPVDPVSNESDFSRRDPAAVVAAFHAGGDGIKRVGYPIRLTRTQLVTSTWITPSMLRLTLTGDDIAHFHTYQADDHVRLVMPRADGTRDDPVPTPAGDLHWPRPHPPSRKYTVRRFDRSAREIDLDVVAHDGGLASTWAMALRPGDEVVLAGPPGAKAFAHTYDHYLFAVDPTGLPALARWLEEAPDDVRGTAWVDIDHPHEATYPLARRSGFTVHWTDRSTGSRQAQQIQQSPLPAGRVLLFGAGEASDLKPLRAWAREHQVAALVTGYWKRGVADLDD